jgi:hypothetical protein
MSTLRYRLRRWAPMAPSFSATRFLIAVHAISVRPLSSTEIRLVSGLGAREVTALLVELKSMDVLDVDIVHAGAAVPAPIDDQTRAIGVKRVAMIDRMLSIANRTRPAAGGPWSSTLPCDTPTRNHR